MVVGDSNDCVVAGMNYKVRVEINVTLDVACIVSFTRRVKREEIRNGFIWWASCG